MSPVKFVHVLKRIEALERDISEILMIQDDVNPDRDYSTSLKITLEQQVNNLLNEKVKLMEVRIENAPEYLKGENRKSKPRIEDQRPSYSFDHLEREYYEQLRYKRSNYKSDAIKINENTQNISMETQKKESKNLPSLAEKSMVKQTDTKNEDEKTFLKRREDLLKNLPPLEY